MKKPPDLSGGLRYKASGEVRLLGLCLSYLALSLQGGALFHLKAHCADGTGNNGGRRKPASREIAIASDFPFNHGFLCTKVTLYRGVLPDRKTSLGVDVSCNRSVEDEVGGTVKISFDLDVA